MKAKNIPYQRRKLQLKVRKYWGCCCICDNVRLNDKVAHQNLIHHPSIKEQTPQQHGPFLAQQLHNASAKDVEQTETGVKNAKRKKRILIS
jgi:hypothetical protein